MVMVQVNLSEAEDYIVSLYKVKNKLKSKQEAIKEILSGVKP